MPPTPRQILETLLPHLRVAAAYARQIQSRIVAQPDKASPNFFAAALSDADLSIQTFVEVLLLGLFPKVRFYGEEYEKTYNTKYFKAIDLGEQDDYLITLDPIDGTQFYLDGFSNYQIILNILNRDDYEAALAISPALDIYHYALRGQGCWRGSLDTPLPDCQPWKIQTTGKTVILGWELSSLVSPLSQHYSVIDLSTDYSRQTQIPTFNAILSGELAGCVLKAGQWIDSAALAFMAQAGGCIVTGLDGQPLPPLHTNQNYRRSGVLVAVSPQVHQHLLAAVQSLPKISAEIS
ncbi:MAG: inositol monophosphatase family protein [Pegethrix bostrychoides GSE-TBD4-15B]|jgi:fructose-1,6-bisphosphatase/inositol monophosphatase family enzyme|uniref:Inositol monophosphatase family protein n=1 Tax=Pegethrix bostrychoides GSE-TBD4-15B TaxID=2839662 RepID=A0A951U371_9CYAN|nr:inositol monophosphatase family protein [Pegethrix bostrychoides GSE-TBD4-15B]